MNSGSVTAVFTLSSSLDYASVSHDRFFSLLLSTSNEWLFLVIFAYLTLTFDFSGTTL